MGIRGKKIKAPEPTASEYGMDGAKEGVFEPSVRRNPRLIGSHTQWEAGEKPRQRSKEPQPRPPR